MVPTYKNKQNGNIQSIQFKSSIFELSFIKVTCSIIIVYYLTIFNTSIFSGNEIEDGSCFELAGGPINPKCSRSKS